MSDKSTIEVRDEYVVKYRPSLREKSEIVGKTTSLEDAFFMVEAHAIDKETEHYDRFTVDHTIVVTTRSATVRIPLKGEVTV